MAIDFQLNNQGDFVLSNMRQYERLRIDWVDNNAPLRIDFEQGEEQVPYEMNDKQMCINFMTEQGEKTLNAKGSSVHDIEEIKQRLIIKLRTELGEMRLKPEIGSYLVTQRHEDIMSQQTRTNVYQIVYAELGDLVENPKVIVTPKKKIGTPFYCQNLNVYVYDDDKLLFDLKI